MKIENSKAGAVVKFAGLKRNCVYQGVRTGDYYLKTDEARAVNLRTGVAVSEGSCANTEFVEVAAKVVIE